MIHEVKKAKQSRTQHDKLEQRLSQQREFQGPLHFKALPDQGVYQIGDV
jgi:hypothetical protein